MSSEREESGLEENATVRSIVLMSTLATAADVVHSMSERRSGRDPSAQEDPEVAAAFVRAATIELEEHLLALQASRVLSEKHDASHSVLLSRRMNEVMILNYIARVLHLVHQRTMSLYPSVSGELVEEARRMHRECTALRDEDETLAFEAFTARLREFCGVLRSAV